MEHKTAEELLSKNVGEIISVSLISETELREEIRMKGKLKEIMEQHYGKILTDVTEIIGKDSDDICLEIK